ncbi:MarR family winged helix-turn-helix transcriptional regulator [Actinokineospora diospyrosa]|uniref:MarR family winged helix-turn-helix transcriptional regulator n=1 Tax=Actinokineospora diospyrosa TaxID=103728 RepID=UPI0020A46DFA|nr:MarR family winged helix-turn-helix transcriptional regulator [Actinokineospora diospyrosa]
MLTAEIPALLAMAFRTVMDEVHESLAAEGFDDVRPAHGFVFQYLSHRQAGATAVELGVHLGVTKQAAVQLVDELEARGYVERRPHPTDRRSRMVVLAPRGWACVASVVRRWNEIEARWVDLIGADQVDHLRADLQRIVTASGQAVALRPVW